MDNQNVFCTNCGKACAAGAAFCTNCGAPMATPAIDETPATDPVPESAPVAEVAPAAIPYQQPVYQQPVAQLKTNRGLLKFILLGIITFGIYPLVVMSTISTDINLIAGRYDGKKTMHYCLVYFIFSWLTLGIVPIVWFHKISNRIGNELRRRCQPYSFGAGSFWGWCVLGSLIVVGPFIYYHKLFKAMNHLAADFNARG